MNKRYYAEGADAKYVQTHTWMSLVPYFVKKLNKLGKVTAKSIVETITELEVERDNLNRDIEYMTHQINNSASQQERVVNSLKLDYIKYSWLTYTDQQFNELREYLLNILILKYKELISKYKKSVADNKFIEIAKNIDEYDNRTVINALTTLMNNNITLDLPYKNVYKNMQLTHNFQYGKSR